MHDPNTNTPAWLSPEDQDKWLNNTREQESDTARPALTPKPFESLPATSRSAPAVTNSLPEDL